MTRQSGIRRVAVILSAAALASALTAEEPEADPGELPRVPAVALGEALATFETREGFTLRLAAGEPQVTDPIAICFDADGRLYAVEMRDYPERREEALGRIRLLEDADDDGSFETSTVFAAGLKWPTSVTCFEGGVFVVVTPDILYLKDTDGDGVADTREVVFTGLAEGVPVEKLNMEGLANGLQWGPDNRIWGTSSTSGGKLRRPGQEVSKGIDLGGRDFSFDPKTRALREEHGGGQNGMSFDSLGRRYICSNSRHLMAVMWEKAWAARDGVGRGLPAPVAGIAGDGDAAPVFRISPDEPWRIVRTRWRVAGVVGGPVEGGGRVSGYFTGASGVTIYTGDAYGADFAENAFIADVGSNLVHRKIVRHADGGESVALEAARPVDEADREFLASRDNWFRPTNFANAPDGCLYIVDMYREVVEHPWSLPEGIKKHLDLYAGMDRGRIYRVEPEGWQRRATPKLSALESDALAALLDHPNGWHRATAQRLLYERGDTRAGSGWARDPEQDSPFGLFREVLAMGATGSEPSAEEWSRVEEIAALAGERDPWLAEAVLIGIAEPGRAESLWQRLRRGGVDRGIMLEGVLRWIGAHGGDAMVEKVADAARAIPVSEAGMLELGPLLEGRASRKLPVEPVLESLKRSGVLESARAMAFDESADETTRLAALRICGYTAETEGLARLLVDGQPDALRREVLGIPSVAADPGFADAVIAAWGSFDPRLRALAFDRLLVDDGAGALALLDAVSEKTIDPATLPAEAGSLARAHRNPKLRKRMDEILPETVIESREEALFRYRAALSLEGDATKGAVKFGQLCAGCHRAGGSGFAVGPDLQSVKAAGRESILTNLVDPNRQVAPQYRSYVIRLADGSTVAGLIARETVEEVTVLQAFGMEKTFPRKDVRSMESAGKSLMTEGLEAALTVEEMADLLAFMVAL